MKIVIFMSGGFDTYGPSRHLYDALIEDLLATKNQVHLIESHTSGADLDAPEKFTSNKNFSYEIVRMKTATKHAFVKRYVFGVQYCFKSIKPLKKARRMLFDLIMVQSCPWAPFAVLFAKTYTKLPVVWNVQDMFPGSSIASGVMKSKVLQIFFFKLQKIAYKHASIITVISDDMKNKIIEQNVESRKIRIIVNWYDNQTVREVDWENNRFAKKYSLDNKKFYVQYAGTMGFVFDYSMIIKVATILKNERDIIFHMIGFGSQKDMFISIANTNALKNINFFPLEPQNMVADVYSACNVCLIPLKKGVIGNSVPSKAGLLMACKRPIIASTDADSCFNKMINENHIGFAFGTDEPQRIADAILFLRDNRSKCFEFGQNAFDYGHQIYSREVNTKKYIDLFYSIIRNDY